jgi:hypothetical protein
MLANGINTKNNGQHSGNRRLDLNAAYIDSK